MPRWLKITGIGCGGLLVLLILIGACTALVSGPTDTPTEPAEQQDPVQEEQQAGEQQQEQDQEAQEEGGENTVGIGEPLTVGETAWVVTNAEQRTELTDSLGQSQTGNFVVVDFEFTNNSSEAVTLDSAMLKLLDAEGNENEPDTDAMLYVEPERNVFLNQVNPGVTQQGTSVFTVAEGASGFTLEVAEGFFATETGFVELGF